MPIVAGLLGLVAVYLVYKMLVDGWLWKIILFFAGWVGLYVILAVYFNAANVIAVTLGEGTTISWAALVPTIICLLCLLGTKVRE